MKSDHPRLVLLAVRWARGRTGGVVLAEPRTWWTARGQCPDVLAWPNPAGRRWRAGSVLVEAKASRADFLADRKKPIHARPEDFPGVRRYYLAPPGLIAAPELPERWGLLEPSGSSVTIRHEAQPWVLSVAGCGLEARILLAMLIRWQIGAEWLAAEARFVPRDRSAKQHRMDLARRRGEGQLELLP